MQRIWDRVGCGGVAVLLVLIGTVLFLTERHARAVERDTRAPMIIAEPVARCALAPGGQYLMISSAEAAPFYQMQDRTALPLPITIDDLLRQEGGDFWLTEDSYYVYTAWVEERDGDTLRTIPTNGYLIAMPSQTITDVMTLPLPERTRILAQARDRLVAIATEFAAPPGSLEYAAVRRSPDNHYAFWEALGTAAEITANTYDSRPRVYNRIPAHVRIQGCKPGWRPDSQGCYVIDRQGLDAATDSPVRLLLVDPPFPLWAWVWRVAGWLISLGILILAWLVT